MFINGTSLTLEESNFFSERYRILYARQLAKKYKFNIKQTAYLLGVSTSTYRRLRKKYNLIKNS